ncbi:MAG: hypothetical protein A2756_04745 [Candidatus Ryanbacteria bacterium RIFCSPHIGHO2_01_FULL_48_27]|uniref:Uncharacterized protein n=1 Tax=Candidatus Ryanbacteria bacterium RIFCSPHIGHO2_01_FULL_48_27 TaxID=1802115 RepID=A0A1G2G151_9BACT|nr:MAG: hypothetical protein A2756_04745 [Candidatus Ryanbacteria bacterium RIFCSPHIGHO2_01_FULL_48_27]
MITLRTAMHKKLRHAIKFSFRPNNTVVVSEPVYIGSEQGKTIQRHAVDGVRTILKGISECACKVDVHIGAHHGKAHSAGWVEAYDKAHLDTVENILKRALTAAKAFAHSYPQSSFAFHVTQTIEITEVVTGTVH